MRDGLSRHDTSNPTVKSVEGRETPPGDPEQDIIARAEYPHQGQIGKSKDAGPVADILRDLKSLRSVSSGN